MPLTEVPQIDRQFRDTITLTQETRSMVKRSPYYSEASCYLLSGLDLNCDSFRDSFILTPINEVPLTIDRQLAIIYLSQHLVKNAQTLEGKALGVMNKTSARLFSKTPTHL